MKRGYRQRSLSFLLPKVCQLNLVIIVYLENNIECFFCIPSTRKPSMLDLVYSDVCGPIDMGSIGGNKNFVTFIDDASRKVWVYFMNTKDQVFEHFKKFHAMAKRKKRKPLKCLRTKHSLYICWIWRCRIWLQVMGF